VCCVSHEVASGHSSGAVVDLRGEWETPVGCVARSKVPRLPQLQALRVVEEVGVVSSSSHAPTCSTPVSLPRSIGNVFWSFQVPRVVSLCLFRSCGRAFVLLFSFALLSFSLARFFCVCCCNAELCFLLIKYMSKHVLKKKI
jgi:hypothetical protein